MVETLLDTNAPWLSGTGSDADIVPSCACRLSRNLSDFHFPSRCRDDERASIEERMRTVIESLNLLSTGTYWSLDELSPIERRLLAERRLIGAPMVDAVGGHGGIFISDDQSLSVAVNGENHLTIRGIGSGLQLQEVWSRVSMMDDTLTTSLDYAFDERLGYLTTAIDEVGTGLRASVDVHIPVSFLPRSCGGLLNLVTERRHRFSPDQHNSPGGDSDGNLARIENKSTLGVSEDEILFHLKHLTGEMVEQLRTARTWLLRETPLQMEDLVGRALGLARGARMLTVPEALRILSTMRFGVAAGLLDHVSAQQINELSIACRDAHLAFKSGAELDSLALNAERADLFRARFA